MKIHIFRWATPNQVDIGDVVLWDNDDPIEIESITRTKDGYDLTGHNQRKPSNRAIVIRPRGEKVRVAPTKAQETEIRTWVKGALADNDWEVVVVNDFTPLLITVQGTPTAVS